MSRAAKQAVATAVVFLFLGMGAAAAVFAFLPNPGSPPSIFDDFKWSSTANGFWHVNAIGSKTTIKHSVLTLTGDEIELDHRIQTDPNQTDIVAKVRGRQFHKFGLGIGVYHAGTVALEFDNDGVKCGRGTDFGWKVDIMKPWSTPPANQWFYLEISVKNPYPNDKDLVRAEKLAVQFHKKSLIHAVTVTCSMYDASGHLIVTDTPHDPPTNAHYVSFDEAFMRTWDGGNNYQVDWIYAGSPSGNPLQGILAAASPKHA